MITDQVPSHNINPLNAELNPICHLLALLGGATIVVVSRLRVKLPVFPLVCNTEGLETSHGCPSHSILLRRKVCVTVQSVVHSEQMVDCVSAVALCCIFRQLLVNSPCPLSNALELLKMII